MKIILTGTPGTGKTSLAGELGKLLNMPVIDVNAVAKRSAVKKKEKIKGRKNGWHTEIIVDLKKLRSALAREMKKKENANCVVEGHLACEVALPASIVVVLRCDPFVLRSRLRKRFYPEKKISENVLAEALDYCLVKAEENYGAGKVIQINATKGVSAMQLAARARVKKSDWVNWGKALASFASQGL